MRSILRVNTRIKVTIGIYLPAAFAIKREIFVPMEYFPQLVPYIFPSVRYMRNFAFAPALESTVRTTGHRLGWVRRKNRENMAGNIFLFPQCAIYYYSSAFLKSVCKSRKGRVIYESLLCGRVGVSRLSSFFREVNLRFLRIVS